LDNSVFLYVRVNRLLWRCLILSHIRHLLLLRLNHHLPLAISFHEFGFFFRLLKIFPLLKEIFEFLVDKFDLTMAQWVSLSIDQAFDGVKLVHDYEIGVVMLVVDGVNIW